MTRLIFLLILSLHYRKTAYQTSLIEITYYSKMKVSRLTTFHPYSRELTRAFCVCHARISRIFQNVCNEIKTNSNAPQEWSQLYFNSCNLPFLNNFSNTHQKRIARMLCLKIYYTASIRWPACIKNNPKFIHVYFSAENYSSLFFLFIREVTCGSCVATFFMHVMYMKQQVCWNDKQSDNFFWDPRRDDFRCAPSYSSPSGQLGPL